MATHTSWSEVDTPTEAELREKLIEEDLSPELWTANDGENFEVHTHDFHKVLYCVEGSIWFMFPDDPDTVIGLEPGDRLDLPAGIRHRALVGMEGGVVCLEAHRKLASTK